MKKKNIFAAVIISILAVSLVSAALLSYYGRVVSTVQVEQSIQLMGEEDWMTCSPDYDACTVEDEVWEAAPGGEEFCFAHSMRNRMSEPGDVELLTTYNPDGEGITTTYYGYEVYLYTEDFTVMDLGVVVEDDGEWLTWTYTFAETPTHTPKMTVAIDYPDGFAITTFDDGTHDGWYYAPDPDEEASRVRFADYAGGTYEDWVETSAVGNVLTVSIKKSALGDSFHWHGYGNYNGNQVWINADKTGTGYGDPAFEVTLSERVALGMPITLESGEVMKFDICHAFAQNIMPGTYEIETRLV